MTDTRGGESVVDDVVVTGQRRPPGSGGAFNGRFDPPAGEVPVTLVPEDGIEPQPTRDRCADPVEAIPWNADAAGAGSVPDFLDAAAGLGFADAPDGSPRLSNREFARGLTRGPNGSVIGGNVSWGPPIPRGGSGTVDVDLTGIDPFNYLGDVHTHPNGDPLPSDFDWNGFMNNNRAARSVGRSNEYFYMYVFAVNPDGVTGTTYVYRDGPRAADSDDPPKPTLAGPEINPDAQPCL